MFFIGQFGGIKSEGFWKCGNFRINAQILFYVQFFFFLILYCVRHCIGGTSMSMLDFVDCLGSN